MLIRIKEWHMKHAGGIVFGTPASNLTVVHGFYFI
jgi:hypothetical protein